MQNASNPKLKPNLSPAGAWSFALGTSIGWGSLVVTANTYLAQAGPMGSLLGIGLGCLIMLIISCNYAYMMSCFPEAGGAYAFAREAFGYDHAFLNAWFLILTYFAMLWANATSLPLFARYFLGPVFQFGRLYTLFGYDVYFGEALLSIFAILLVAFLCIRFRDSIARLMVGLVALFSAGITIAFIVSIFGDGFQIAPAFIPEKNSLSQIIRIAVISPWAFIGFESISHTTEEFSFKHSRIFPVLLISVITTTLLYIFVILLSVTAYPPEYSSWLEYIQDLDNLSGIDGLPAFYAANRYMGSFGVGLLIISLFALILTSLIGNITALSRLFYALGKDDILPTSFAGLNRHGAPSRAILLVAVVSIFIPFLGRTAIGWIVDVTTLGATLIYGIVSASALKLANTRKDRLQRYTGIAGVAIMIGFGIYLLVPNLFGAGSMEAESYFLFMVWAVLGFFIFRAVLRKDQAKRFGQSIIVWIALLSLILFVSLVWMSRNIMSATTIGFQHINAFYASADVPGGSSLIMQEINNIRAATSRSIIVVILVFALSLGVLLNNYALMSRRVKNSELQLGRVRDMAHRDPLTGVKSKHAYAEKEQEIDSLIKAGNAGAFAVVVCDVNGLKFINDTQGHKAGDQYIRQACHLICELFQHSPVYRTGGDEFVVLLAGRDYEQREEIMKELHETSLAHISEGGVVVSGGISDFSAENDTTIHTVFERADALMYKEKQFLKSMGAATR